jgi:hypothetical protein
MFRAANDTVQGSDAAMAESETTYRLPHARAIAGAKPEK